MVSLTKQRKNKLIINVWMYKLDRTQYFKIIHNFFNDSISSQIILHRTKERSLNAEAYKMWMCRPQLSRLLTAKLLVQKHVNGLNVGFVVYKLVLEHVFLQVLWFSVFSIMSPIFSIVSSVFSIMSPILHPHIRSFIAVTMWRQDLSLQMTRSEEGQGSACGQQDAIYRRQ